MMSTKGSVIKSHSRMILSCKVEPIRGIIQTLIPSIPGDRCSTVLPAGACRTRPNRHARKIGCAFWHEDVPAAGELAGARFGSVSTCKRKDWAQASTPEPPAFGQYLGDRASATPVVGRGAGAGHTYPKRFQSRRA